MEEVKKQAFGKHCAVRLNTLSNIPNKEEKRTHSENMKVTSTFSNTISSILLLIWSPIIAFSIEESKICYIVKKTTCQIQVFNYFQTNIERNTHL